MTQRWLPATVAVAAVAILVVLLSGVLSDAHSAPEFDLSPEFRGIPGTYVRSAATGLWLHYRRWGQDVQGAAPPSRVIVIMSELGSSVDSLDAGVSEWLKSRQDTGGAGLDVFAVEPEGFGRSEGTRGHVRSLFDLEADFEAMVNKARSLAAENARVSCVSIGMAEPALIDLVKRSPKLCDSAMFVQPRGRMSSGDPSLDNPRVLHLLGAVVPKLKLPLWVAKQLLWSAAHNHFLDRGLVEQGWVRARLLSVFLRDFPEYPVDVPFAVAMDSPCSAGFCIGLFSKKPVLSRALDWSSTA